jgi:hypothetical protein
MSVKASMPLCCWQLGQELTVCAPKPLMGRQGACGWCFGCDSALPIM